jgi:hypothetical protein
MSVMTTPGRRQLPIVAAARTLKTVFVEKGCCEVGAARHGRGPQPTADRRRRAADRAAVVEPDAAPLDQQRAQTHPRAPQAGLGRRQRQSVAIGVVMLTPAIEIAAAQHVVVGGFEPREIALDALGQRIDGRRVVRNGRRHVGVERLRRALPAHIVDQAVAGHLEQPGTRLLDFAEPLALAHGFEKHFLQQVFGAVWIADLVPQESQQFRLVREPRADHAAKGAIG